MFVKLKCLFNLSSTIRDYLNNVEFQKKKNSKTNGYSYKVAESQYKNKFIRHSNVPNVPKPTVKYEYECVCQKKATKWPQSLDLSKSW